MYPIPSLEFTSKNWTVPEGTLPVFDRRVQHLPMQDIILIKEMATIRCFIAVMANVLWFQKRYGTMKNS